MGDRQLGVTGTLRQNRVIGIPLPTKKEVTRKFSRGQVEATYTQDATVVVWRDNQPVYMASNHESIEPMGSCQRYSQKETWVESTWWITVKRTMPSPPG
jgi:hypothetical protein